LLLGLLHKILRLHKNCIIEQIYFQFGEVNWWRNINREIPQSAISECECVYEYARGINALNFCTLKETFQKIAFHLLTFLLLSDNTAQCSIFFMNSDLRETFKSSSPLDASVQEKIGYWLARKLWCVVRAPLVTT
jgi:hypothetical protein